MVSWERSVEEEGWWGGWGKGETEEIGCQGQMSPFSGQLTTVRTRPFRGEPI